METTSHDERLYAIALSQIPKIGPSLFKNIVSYTGSPRGFFSLPKGKVAKIPGIGPKLLDAIQSKDSYLRNAAELLAEAEKNDVRVLCFMDEQFPQRLKAFSDAPTVLFTRGNTDLNPPRTIGIVGTRNATAYGKSVTARIVEDLSAYAPTVISGLAYGIDIEAHRAALQYGCPTVAILGTPVDKIYPAHHKGTARSMMEKGGLVSEYRIGAPLNPSNFPQRNRIIAGLSDAVIVVEAAKKGGALITAEIAYSYNKEVFAVPGNLQSNYSEGCNNLIRSLKAGIYMGPKDIEDALSWKKDGEQSEEATISINLEEFEPMEQAILQLLIQEKQLEIDQLSWRTQIPIPTLAAKLLTLEFQGLIKSMPGKKYLWSPQREK